MEKKLHTSDGVDIFILILFEDQEVTMSRVLGNTVMNISSTKKECGTHVLNSWSFYRLLTELMMPES